MTEQGSSTSHMTAAKVLDVMSRRPGCAGQAYDAVSAHTQVKLEDAPELLGLPEAECPSIYHDPAAQSRGTKFKIQWYRLKGICDNLKGLDRKSLGKITIFRTFINAPRKRIVSLCLCRQQKM